MGKGQSFSFCSGGRGSQICVRGREQEQPGLKEAGTGPRWMVVVVGGVCVERMFPKGCHLLSV